MEQDFTYSFDNTNEVYITNSSNSNSTTTTTNNDNNDANWCFLDLKVSPLPQASNLNDNNNQNPNPVRLDPNLLLLLQTALMNTKLEQMNKIIVQDLQAVFFKLYPSTSSMIPVWTVVQIKDFNLDLHTDLSFTVCETRNTAVLTCLNSHLFLSITDLSKLFKLSSTIILFDLYLNQCPLNLLRIIPLTSLTDKYSAFQIDIGVSLHNLIRLSNSKANDFVFKPLFQFFQTKEWAEMFIRIATSLLP
jgi:hypothetical protein